MNKTMVTYTLDTDVVAKFNAYPNRKRSALVNSLLRGYFELYNSNQMADIEGELSYLQQQEIIIQTKKNQLEQLKQQKEKELEQQKLTQSKINEVEHKKFIEQEKHNMPQIENEFIKELEKWDQPRKDAFNIEWQKHLEDNKLLINDLNRIQYWWRYIKNKKVD